MKRAAYAGALILTIASVAAAQTPRPTVMFRHGSTINLFAGGASARSTTAVVGGAGVGWELSPRIAIEGTGQWLAWGSDTHAFAAALIAQAGMVRVGSVMPFLSGGVGLSRRLRHRRTDAGVLRTAHGRSADRRAAHVQRPDADIRRRCERCPEPPLGRASGRAGDRGVARRTRLLRDNRCLSRGLFFRRPFHRAARPAGALNRFRAATIGIHGGPGIHWQSQP